MSRSLCLLAALSLAVNAYWSENNTTSDGSSKQQITESDTKRLANLQLSSFQQVRAQRLIVEKEMQLSNHRKWSREMVANKNKQISILEAHIANLEMNIQKRKQHAATNSELEMDKTTLGQGCDGTETSFVEKHKKVSERAHHLLEDGHTMVLGSKVSATTPSTVCTVSTTGYLDCSIADSSIKELAVVNSGVISIDAGSFAGLVNLESLRLSNNGITSIPDDTFTDLPSLTFLDISDNNIGDIVSNVLAPLTKLGKLMMAGNMLTMIDDSLFFNNPNLKIIDISSNQITTIGSSLSGLSKLMKFNANFNPLTLESTTFIANPELRYLTLRGAELSVLPTGVFDSQTQLISLSLTDNNLQTLGTAFTHLTTVKYLYLSNNKLSDTNEQAFLGMTRIQYLHLDRNEYTDIPDLTDCDRVTQLRLNKNKLGAISEDRFTSAPMLRVLYMLDNPDLDFGDEAWRWPGLGNLRNLYTTHWSVSDEVRICKDVSDVASMLIGRKLKYELVAGTPHEWQATSIFKPAELRVYASPSALAPEDSLGSAYQASNESLANVAVPDAKATMSVVDDDSGIVAHLLDDHIHDDGTGHFFNVHEEGSGEVMQHATEQERNEFVVPSTPSLTGSEAIHGKIAALEEVVSQLKSKMQVT